MVDISNDTGARPIAAKDRAETFTESDVTVTSTGNTKIKDGFIGLINEQYSGSISIDFNYGQENLWYGVTFYPKQENTYKIELTWAGETIDAKEIKVVRNDTGETVYSDTNPNYSNNDILTISPTNGFSEDTFYYIAAKAGPNASFNYNAVEVSSSKPNVETSGFRVEPGPYSDQSPTSKKRFCAFDSFKSYVKKQEGTVTVGWPQPNDVYRWDAATFQTSPDGETIEVYVEESTDGGSTWTEIQGPISRGDQIEAAPDSRVRFRVELSQSNFGNPTLDAIYRRWVV